jgi:aspartyl-tRNA(Asn)/glutamyl-tRNA(Gln) amidotransferase subunit C
MSSIDQKQLEKVAHLARLALGEQQLETHRVQFERLLDFVAAVQGVDCGEVEPMAHPLEAVQRLREDRVTEVDQADDFQALAPDVVDGLYRVPKVIQ